MFIACSLAAIAKKMKRPILRTSFDVTKSQRIEIRNLACNAASEPACVEARDRPDSASSLPQRGPALFRPHTDCGDEAYAP